MSMFNGEKKEPETANALPEGSIEKKEDGVASAPVETTKPVDKPDDGLISAEDLPKHPLNPGAVQLTKCPDCGAPYKFKKWNIGGSPLLVPVYTCGCREKKRLAWEKQQLEAEQKHRYSLFVGNCKIPARCLENTYDIPDKHLYEADGDEIITNLEYDKFFRMVKDPKFYLTTYPGIFVPGNPGTRKTSYVCEVGKQVMKLGWSVVYYQSAELITNKINIWELVRPTFLIIDDLGNDTIENRNNLLWTLVNKRIDEKKFTAIITNYSEEHNRAIFGDAFMDRLKLYLPVVMIGESSRKIA